MYNDSTVYCVPCFISPICAICGICSSDLSLRCLMETVRSKTTDTSALEPCAKRPRTDIADKSVCNSNSNSSQMVLPDSKKSHCVSRKSETDLCDKPETQFASRESNGAGPEGEPLCQVGETETPVLSSSGDKRVVGVVIALCCHHQCGWRAYVGKRFMRQCGLSAADFSLLTRLTSWAVCGWRDRDGSLGTRENKVVTDADKQRITAASGQPAEDEDVGHDTEDLLKDDSSKGEGLQLSEKEKEMVGWKCKRLIDYGRVLYLQDMGLHSQLKIYVDAQQTPENVVLVATLQ